MGIRLLLAICVGACVGACEKAERPLPTADELFARTAAAYGGALSYVDQGELVNVFSEPNGFTARLTFTTAFLRPDRFRFEYRDEGDPARAFVAWSGGGRVRSVWYLDEGPDHPENLSMALGGATGVSSGVSSLVPRLLMPVLAYSRSELALEHARVEGIEPVDGHRCYKLSGTTEGTESSTRWIDVDTYLLRKVADRKRLVGDDGGEFFVDRTIRYTPVLNRSVDAVALAEPPTRF